MSSANVPIPHQSDARAGEEDTSSTGNGADIRVVETEPVDFDYATFPPRLNLGCGFDRREGYLNVDFQDFHGPDLVADVRRLGLLPSAYYDEVIAQDVLEHLPRTDIRATLVEWGRLLAPGGRLVLRVPDVLGLAKLLAARQTIEEQDVLLQCLFGTQAYTGDFHSFGFTELALRHYLAEAGFTVAELEHRDEWLFDAVAIRVAGDAVPDLSDLRFMSLVPDHPPAGPPPEPRDESAWPRAQAALAAARAFTDPAGVDLSATRLRIPKMVALRVLRLVTARQREHNRLVEDALEAVLSSR